MFFRHGTNCQEKLVFEIVTSIEDVTSKWSSGSSFDTDLVNTGIF